VIWNHQKITERVRPQNTTFSAALSAIITATQFTIKEPGRKLIATDSLSTLNKKDVENQRTPTIRKLLGQEGDNIMLLWVPSHVRIPGNDEAENAAREALDENLDKPLAKLCELDN
jgi:hypothetical protein